MTQNCAIILAGGLSTRMGGGNKALRMLGGETLLTHVIRRLKPQTDRLAINANGEVRTTPAMLAADGEYAGGTDGFFAAVLQKLPETPH